MSSGSNKKLSDYYNIIAHRSFRYTYKPVKQYQQLYFNRNLNLIKTKPVYNLKDFNKKHSVVRKRNLIHTQRRKIMDLTEFSKAENNAEVEFVDCDRAESPAASQHSSSAEDNSDEEILPGGSSGTNYEKQLALLQQQVECLQSTNRLLEEKVTAQTTRAQKRKNVSSSGESSKKAKYKLPPPPISGQVAEKTLKEKTTVLSLLTSLAAMVTIRLEDYGDAFHHFLKLQDSKAPVTALRILSDLLTDWYNLTISMDGKNFLVESLTSCYEQKWSTRSIAPATSDCLARFFKSFAEPGATGPDQSVASPSSHITIPRPAPTTTLSMIATGTTRPANAGGLTSGNPSRKVGRQRDLQKFIPKIFSDLQSISAREGDILFTSRSRVPSGSTIIKLEIYQKDNVEHLTRDKWWTAADFRGTMMTDNPEIIEAATTLMDLLESEMEQKPNVECTRSSISNMGFKYK